MLKLIYCYTDEWARPVYEDESGRQYKDVACGRKRWGAPALHTVTCAGEPDCPLRVDYEIEGGPHFEN